MDEKTMFKQAIEKFIEEDGDMTPVIIIFGDSHKTRGLAMEVIPLTHPAIIENETVKKAFIEHVFPRIARDAKKLLKITAVGFASIANLQVISISKEVDPSKLSDKELNEMRNNVERIEVVISVYEDAKGKTLTPYRINPGIKLTLIEMFNDGPANGIGGTFVGLFKRAIEA